MESELEKLDNPAWHALTETHAHFAQGSEFLKKYDPSVVIFSGYDTQRTDFDQQLDKVFNQGDSFFLFDQLSPLPDNYAEDFIVECEQMVCENLANIEITEQIIPLEKHHWQEMFALINRVFPGYYLFNTPLMGDYCGIFKEKKLIAVAGERLKMHGLTEISAVVTDPEYAGKGYAQQLVTQLSQKNLNVGIRPFLHTGKNNERAIRLYELLGYRKRRLITVTKFRRL